MKRLKAIWKLLTSRCYVVYTSNCFGKYEVSYKADEVTDLPILKSFIEDQIEAEQGVHYTRSLITFLHTGE